MAVKVAVKVEVVSGVFRNRRRSTLMKVSRAKRWIEQNAVRRFPENVLRDARNATLRETLSQ